MCGHKWCTRFFTEESDESFRNSVNVGGETFKTQALALAEEIRAVNGYGAFLEGSPWPANLAGFLKALG